jgi:hypothetical protein
VPQGHTIKIINTYGRQVVDTWAFVLGLPPQEDDIDEEEKAEANGETEATLGATEDVNQEVEGEKSTVEEGAAETTKEEAEPRSTAENVKDEATEKAEKTTEKVTEETSQPAEEAQKTTEDVAGEAGQAPEEPQKTTEGATEEAQKTTEGATEEPGKTTEKVTEKVNGDSPKRTWSSYVPSLRRSKGPEGATEKKEDEEERKAGGDKADATAAATDTTKDATTGGQKATDDAEKKSGWSAYVPSLPSVRASAPKKLKQPKEQRTWASHLPSGQGFSGYNTAKSSISAFMAQHQRDPTKSVAEQLYDFSKTPVGAAGLSGEPLHTSNINLL